MILAAMLAITLPTDRSYMLVETARPAAEISQCAEAFFDKGGTATVEATAYGHKVDYRFGNLGGAVKDPTMTLEIHDGDQRTLILYGFKSWRGAVHNIWKQMSKSCFPELFDQKPIKR